jgi:hypothetical protein
MGMGGTDKASKQAASEEAARQTAIKGAQSGINSAYDSPQRKAEIADYVNSLRKFFGDDLARQKGDTDRQLKFALAKSGLTGGSTNIDQQKRVGENYARGVLDVERKAQGGGANLESLDQDSRMRLISMATQGLDATTAASQSASAMRSGLNASKATDMANGLGDVFANTKSFYQKAADDAVRRRADYDAYSNYAPSKNIFGGA